MDINQTLRDLQAAILNGERDLFEYVIAIQSWLQRGGFQPLWLQCPLATGYFIHSARYHVSRSSAGIEPILLPD